MQHSHLLHPSRHRHKLFEWQSIAFVFVLIAILLIVLQTASVIQIDRAAFFGGFLASLVRVTIAYIIAFILAVILAIVTTSNKYIESVLLPILDVLQSFPSFVLFPILLIALKNSPNTIIIMVLVITIIWPIVFAIISGIKGRREDLEEAATVFGAKGLKRFMSFTLPVLFPAIVTGSLVGWGEGWEFIIGAELLVHTKIGVGQYLGDISSAGKSGLLIFGIIFLLLLLFIINKLVWLPLLHRSTRFQADA